MITPEMKEELRQTMLEFLALQGIDPTDPRIVLQVLPGMWQAIQETNLLPPYITYEMFAAAAEFQAMKIELEGRNL